MKVVFVFAVILLCSCGDEPTPPEPTVIIDPVRPSEKIDSLPNP